jgi:hypothetical protein
VVCKDIGVSGWGNQAGIAYQQAHAVLTCLGMLDEEDPGVTSIGVESKEDVFDLELRNASGTLIKSRQIKTRQLDRTWAPSDVYPLIRRWATLVRPPSATFELVLGGRVGPTGERLIRAVHAASEGDQSQLARIADSQLSASEIEAAARVRITVDPTPTNSLLMAGTQQALAFLADPRAGRDALDEADALMGRLYMLVTQRAGSRNEAERVVTRSEVMALFGLEEETLRGRWDSSAAADYIRAVMSRTLQSTVEVDLRRQSTPIERATGRAEAQSVTLAELLDAPNHTLLAGQSGSGKSTAADTLRRMSAAAGRAAIIVNSEAYIPGRLTALVCNALSVITGHPVPLAVGRGILNDESAIVIFDGTSEMAAAQRHAFVEELAPRIGFQRSCRVVLLGRDVAVLNSVLPHYVPRLAYILRGIRTDQRDELVGNVIRPLGAGTSDVRRVSAQALHALKGAAYVPYLLRIAAELIWYGFDIKGRAQMYTVFTEEMAARRGLVDLQFCLLGLGIAFSRLLDNGHRQCDQFDWRQLLDEAATVLNRFNIFTDASVIERTALQGGFVAYEEYDQIVRPTHDSLADYFAAVAHHKRIAELPASVTENDSLRMRFLAELSGVEESVGELVTRCIPLSCVEISQFDTTDLSTRSRAETTRYLQNLLTGTTQSSQVVQIGIAPDGKAFGFLNADSDPAIIPPDLIFETGFKHGMIEVVGGSLRVAVTLWRSILRDYLSTSGPGWQIPTSAEGAVDALRRHRDETAQAIERIICGGFPEACRHTLLSLAMPEPIDIVIRPTMNPDEPRWPMLWRPSTHWQVTVGDFGLTPVGRSMAYESVAAHVVGRKARHEHGDKEAAHPGAGCAQVDDGGSAAGRGQGHRGGVPRTGRLGGDVSPVAQSVRRVEGRGRQTTQGSRTRELHAQTAVG